MQRCQYTEGKNGVLTFVDSEYRYYVKWATAWAGLNNNGIKSIYYDKKTGAEDIQWVNVWAHKKNRGIYRTMVNNKLGIFEKHWTEPWALRYNNGIFCRVSNSKKQTEETYWLDYWAVEHNDAVWYKCVYLKTGEIKTNTAEIHTAGPTPEYERYVRAR